MINEEAIKRLNKIKAIYLGMDNKSDVKALEMAIKALEQTDGDLISRDFMKKLGATCIAKRSKTGELVAISSIDNLPSAEKTARWKPLDKEKAQYYMFGYLCSKCGAPAKSPTKYCPNCGAKMGESEEEE